MKSMHILLWVLAVVLLPPAVAKDDQEKQQTVGILLYPGVQIIDFTGPYEIFGWAGYKVVTISEDGKPLTANMDLQLTPTHSFANAPKLDILVVPGGDIQNARRSAATLDWVKASAPTAKHVLSVCNGAFILAETGLLNGLSATTFYRALDDFKKSYPHINTLSNQRLVDNGKLITAGGLSAGIDAALHIVSKAQGIAKAKTVAMNVEYPWQPDHGFVRGNMADIQLRGVAEQLPETLRFDELYSYGSESEWRASYKVKSESSQPSLTLAALKKLIDKAMQATGWEPMDEGASRWQKKTHIGERWILAMEYQQSPDGMLLVLHLHK
jgi:putative intracellular protease/amidase